MSEVNLEQVLAAREERAARQREMLDRYRLPLVCFTLNIAGPVKTGRDASYAFRVGRTRLEEGLKTFGLAPAARLDLSSPAGYGLLMAVDADAALLKRLCVSLEETDALGRLFDMDVIAPSGRKLERNTERRCLVCGAPGRGCASRRVHPVEQVIRATREIVSAHRTREESETIARLAVQSLLDEVCASPKPGLVDRFDPGSHGDMDIFTFNASAAALHPYFQKCYLAGVRDRALPPEEAFGNLRALGIEAERVMRLVTGGVNTHKGVIFTLGVMCGAAGRCEGREIGPWLDACAALTARQRAPGVRAEAADGLPSVRRIGLPALEKARAAGLSLNGRCLYVLLSLMAWVRDTNMLARGGPEAAENARSRAKALLSAPEVPCEAALEETMALLNREFVSQRLSPGGCADLLAATLLARRWNAEQALSDLDHQKQGGDSNAETV